MDEKISKYLKDNDFKVVELDDTFRFHCTQCGKCCINREDIILTPKDLFRISKLLKIEPLETFRKYCETYIGSNSGIPIVRLKPRGMIKRCPFLENLKCRIHEAKPSVCALFPLGRIAEMDKKKKTLKMRYIFTKPGCGDNSEEHTAREWLKSFHIPLEDKFFVEWTIFTAELIELLNKNQDKITEDQMSMIYLQILVFIFFNYNINKDFFVQFKENSSLFLEKIRCVFCED